MIPGWKISGRDIADGGYKQRLKLGTPARLISNALLEHGGSGHQAPERAQEAETLPVSITPAYDKLGNLAPAVSIRYCSNTTFAPDPDKPAQESRDGQGHRTVQEWR